MTVTTDRTKKLARIAGYLPSQEKLDELMGEFIDKMKIGGPTYAAEWNLETLLTYEQSYRACSGYGTWIAAGTGTDEEILDCLKSLESSCLHGLSIKAWQQSSTCPITNFSRLCLASAHVDLLNSVRRAIADMGRE